jgi:hypothetical protein
MSELTGPIGYLIPVLAIAFSIFMLFIIATIDRYFAQKTLNQTPTQTKITEWNDEP